METESDLGSVLPTLGGSADPRVELVTPWEVLRKMKLCVNGGGAVTAVRHRCLITEHPWV